MYFTTMDDYNKLKGTDKTLAEDEMMLYSYKTDYEYDPLRSTASEHGK